MAYILVIVLTVLAAEVFGIHWALLGLVLGGDDGYPEHGGSGAGDVTSDAGPAGEPDLERAHDDL